MKLSTAIRKGARIRPRQVFCAFAARTTKCNVGTCAMGAAIEGYYGKRLKWNYDDYDEDTMFQIPTNGYKEVGVWFRGKFGDPYGIRIEAPCPADPACIHPCRSLGNYVEHLNDVHKWSRGKIADWLVSIGY